ncbi:MAG: 50S ribosomal protein L10 [Candidatus Babeliales bacterium]
MNRQEKKQMIDTLKNDFEKSNASFLVGYKGLTVSQLADLRKKLRPEGASLHVAKVTLMRRAIADIPVSNELSSLLGGQIAVVFAQKEVPSVAKVLSDFTKETETFSLIGGYFESSVLSQDSIKQLASLPSREVLLAQVCGTLKAPISKFAQVLNTILVRPLVVLKEIEKKKS